MPDPRHGVFETLLVIDGHPVELDAHLERLNASLAELFPNLPAPDLEEIEVPSVQGSLKIAVRPSGQEFSLGTSTRRIEHQSQPIALHSFPLPGGLGPHKWLDRSLLEEAQARLPAGDLPLIVDRETALEASRANVFVVRRDALLTPPLDGRILPGITRGRVLGLAGSLGIEVDERPLSPGDLLAGDEVFLTGSVRGIEPVRSLDGKAIATAGRVTAELSEELLRTWTAAKVR